MTGLGPVAWPPAPMRTERLVGLDRRDAERPGHVRPDAAEAELGYLFLPEAWGCGYAAEPCAAVRDWFADTFPGEPVVLCTRSADDRAMRLAAKPGFTEGSGSRSFEEYGAEQRFGVWSSLPYGPADRGRSAATMVAHSA
ncbi:GNAT family N-acetyltransferase [Streptomyces sp. NPDC088360]|uniref:GNAT family N-acetyltransferase n=1 Tax=Streptomyces sp. NPDC088360 TaxID=3154515 RepID=UPI003450CC08